MSKSKKSKCLVPPASHSRDEESDAINELTTFILKYGRDVLLDLLPKVFIPSMIAAAYTDPRSLEAHHFLTEARRVYRGDVP
tara:strand:+ start:3857 stop:4102 length:246 start_codon:yes stop_codon:yes gene_type:complete